MPRVSEIVNNGGIRAKYVKRVQEMWLKLNPHVDENGTSSEVYKTFSCGSYSFVYKFTVVDFSIWFSARFWSFAMINKNLRFDIDKWVIWGPDSEIKMQIVRLKNSLASGMITTSHRERNEDGSLNTKYIENFIKYVTILSHLKYNNVIEYKIPVVHIS